MSDRVRGRPLTPLELVGVAEIADRLEVKRGTVDQWRRRGILPAPDWTLAAGPVWRWSTIRLWALKTLRL